VNFVVTIDRASWTSGGRVRGSSVFRRCDSSGPLYRSLLDSRTRLPRCRVLTFEFARARTSRPVGAVGGSTALGRIPGN